MEYLVKLDKCFSLFLSVLHTFVQQSSATFFPKGEDKKIRTPVEAATSVLCCGTFVWHVISGIVFLGLMLAGVSYAVMIGTESYLLQEMWGIVL